MKYFLRICLFLALGLSISSLASHRLIATLLTSQAQAQTTDGPNLRGPGEIRRLHFLSHTKQLNVRVIYWLDGYYIPESIDDISNLFSEIAGVKIRVAHRILDEFAALTIRLNLERPIVIDSIDVRDLPGRPVELRISVPDRTPLQVCGVFAYLKQVKEDQFCNPLVGSPTHPIYLGTTSQRYLITYQDGPVPPTDDVIAMLERQVQSHEGGMALKFVRHLEWWQWPDTYTNDIGTPIYSLPCTHQLTGQIRRGDGQLLSSAISEMAAHTARAREVGQQIGGIVLCLDSPGGSLLDGLQIANTILEAGIATRVDTEAQCNSSCFWIFMAGSVVDADGSRKPWRVLTPGGHLGFHAPALSTEISDATSEEIGAAFQLGTRAVSEIVATFATHGMFSDGIQILKPSLLTDMLGTPPAEMRRIETVEDVGRWDILVDLPPIGPMPERAFRSACERKIAWARDQLVSVSRTRLIVSVQQNQVQVRRPNSDEVLCRYRVEDMTMAEGRITQATPRGEATVFFFDPKSALDDLVH